MAGPLHNDTEVQTVTVLLLSLNADAGIVKLKKAPSVALSAIRERAMTESLRATAFVVALKIEVARPGIADLVLEGGGGAMLEEDADGADEGC